MFFLCSCSMAGFLTSLLHSPRSSLVTHFCFVFVHVSSRSFCSFHLFEFNTLELLNGTRKWPNSALNSHNCRKRSSQMDVKAVLIVPQSEPTGQDSDSRGLASFSTLHCRFGCHPAQHLIVLIYRYHTHHSTNIFFRTPGLNTTLGSHGASNDIHCNHHTFVLHISPCWRFRNSRNTEPTRHNHIGRHHIHKRYILRIRSLHNTYTFL